MTILRLGAFNPLGLPGIVLACRRAFRRSRRCSSIFANLTRIDAQGHAAAQRLARLHEFLRGAERAEAAGEILQGLLAKIEIGVGGEEGTVYLTVLQAGENLLGLR